MKMTEKADEFWKGESNKKVGEVGKPVKKKRKKPVNKINIDAEKMRDGLAQLVLTVLSLLRELMEKQAIRRIEAGSLNDDEIERLGNTFMALKEELSHLRGHFNLEEDDLNMSLGPILLREDEKSEKGQTSVVEILDTLLGKGVVVKGDVVISVAEVDLLSLNLGLLLASIDKARELYGDVSSVKLASEKKLLEEEVSRLKQENLKLQEGK